MSVITVMGEKIAKVKSAILSLVRPAVSMTPRLRDRAAFDDLVENNLLKEFARQFLVLF